MRLKKLSALIAVLTCFMLVFAACEPVGGVNMNNVMKSVLVQESYEGDMSVTIEVLPGDNAWLEESGAAMLAAFPAIEIDVYDYKQQSLSTASMNGNLQVAGLTIPFAMSTTLDEVVLEVEGIERPLVLSTAAIYEEMGMDYDSEELERINIGLVSAVYDYIIPNLPNPESIDVSYTTTDVNGVQQSVRQIHAEINGTELFGMFENALANLAEDEKGLRELLDSLYDLIVPYLVDVIETTAAEFQAKYEYTDPSVNFIIAYLNNKTLVTEFLYTTVSQAYAQAIGELDSLENMIAESSDNILNESSYATADLYIDGNHNIIKSDIEVVLSPGGSEDAGGIAITVSSEKWNINKTVEADLLSSENGIDLEGYYLEEEILSAINGESTLGQILTAFGMNQKVIYVWLDEADVITENGTTLMWDYELIETLSLEEDWRNWSSEKIVLSSGGTTVELPIGENVIIVNGEPHDIPIGAVDTDYGIYLPLRAVAEAFGYEVSWDPVYNTVDIVKTYF